MKRRSNWYSGTVAVMLYSLIALVLINLRFPSSGNWREKAQTPLAAGGYDCQRERVIDGDTVIADCGKGRLTIRLLGIDAPEMGQVPWGGQSRTYLQQILPARFRLQAYGQDVYQRQLGVLWDGMQDLNRQMLQAGMAVVYRSEEMPENYPQAEAQARKARIGVWKSAGNQQNPRIWRRYHH